MILINNFSNKNFGIIKRCLQKIHYHCDHSTLICSLIMSPTCGAPQLSFPVGFFYLHVPTYDKSLLAHICVLKIVYIFLGCTSPPPTPMNSALRCSKYSGCIVDCIPNYKFPNGEERLLVKCNNGQWLPEGVPWDSIPACERK